MGPNLIVKVPLKTETKIGTIVLPEMLSEKTRDMGEEVKIVAMGEDAFSDLAEENRPKIGDLVAIKRYEGSTLGKTVEEVFKEKMQGDFEFRVIQDTRILAIVEVHNE